MLHEYMESEGGIYNYMVDTGEIETVDSNDVARQAVTSIGYKW